ncbi:Probable transcription repressor NiaR [Brevundimonas diminuta]|uniref:helix-turn-helix transcriptional regulator n=1 Tax=Brevundimonas TaxID=41275 RepID=UPI000207F700|nr:MULTISPECIES: YafY family protein [Brevundimonas]EGF95203.1 HTH domain protein [Brevundimonas diminuta ATCC 11568]MBD3818379.1 YafY family transcriptional regulator [Brevundimonas diminuta]OMG58419.1 transcriptional regulator [Brevundimonas sp. ZS04]OWR22544.1 transcriptional regulator [Brevundimonas diminuta]WQE46013.1 YafY family protein [Brevundimonas diminuta]
MSRSERLLDLLNTLRRHRRPVSGRALAEETGVSLRTLYRDIASLQAQGATIEGEPGVGYVLKPGYLLPPLMFTPEEIEALALGSRWVAERADARLRDAALSAQARIAAVLPPDLRDEMEASALFIGPGAPIPADAVDPAQLRKAIRIERKLRLNYRDEAGAASDRVVWPFALAFFDRVRLLIVWCELRGDFRSFRTDRIVEVEVLEARYPTRKAVLLKRWHEACERHGPPR